MSATSSIAASLSTRGTGAEYRSQRGLDYDGTVVAAAPGFDVTAFATTYGARPAAGFTAAIAREQILVSSGPDPAADSTVMPYTYSGSALVAYPYRFTAMAGTAYGVAASVGNLGR